MNCICRLIPNTVIRKWSDVFRLRWYRFSFLIVFMGGLIAIVVRLWGLSQIIPIVFQMDLRDAVQDPRWSGAINTMVLDSLKAPIIVILLCWMVLAAAPFFIPDHRI